VVTRIFFKFLTLIPPLLYIYPIMTQTSIHRSRVAFINTLYTRRFLMLLPLLLAAFVSPARSADDTLFRVYSRAAPQSAVSRSLAGAGSAMPHDIFQGLLNPALTTARIGAKGAFEAGYGRDDVFNKLALPFGAVFFENGGALGVFYRYLNGDSGAVHEATVNFAGRLFEQMDPEEAGPVDFGMNIRYENSKWRYNIRDSAISARGSSLILDIGFYQKYLPGFDFSLVFSNVAGYRWSEADGRDKSEGWIDGRHCLITVGGLYSLPIAGTFLLRIPVDLEVANAFSKSRPTAYMPRVGAELRIAQMYSARFGYARATRDPAELITKFELENLFFGGVGVAVKGFLLDVFAGKNEFGTTITYGY